MDDANAGERSRRVAATLMRMALALLERDGELLVAARLQHALDTFEGSSKRVEDQDGLYRAGS